MSMGKITHLSCQHYLSWGPINLLFYQNGVFLLSLSCILSHFYSFEVRGAGVGWAGLTN